MKLQLIAVGLMAVNLAACSTIANGKNQAVLFSTGDVEGADCVVSGGRDGAFRAEVVTPQEIQVRRAKAAIDIECNKEGYETATKTVESKMEGTTGGNVVAGGFVGLGVDAMTGAMFKYPDTIMIDMQEIGVVTPTVTGEEMAEGEMS